MNEFLALMNGLPMTQTELASRLGVDRSTINHWRRGTRIPSIAKQKAIISCVYTKIGEVGVRIADLTTFINEVERREVGR